MRLVHEQTINAQFFKGQGIIFLVRGGEGFQFGLQSLLRFFQFFHQAPVLRVGMFAPDFFQFLHLLPEKAHLGFLRERNAFKAGMRDDDESGRLASLATSHGANVTYKWDTLNRLQAVDDTTDGTRSLLLPLDQFAFAELTSEDKEQRLRLVFATHEVLISGHVLRRIEAAMQRLELSGLMKLPDKYHALIADNQPKIRDIVVTESKVADSQPRALN